MSINNPLRKVSSTDRIINKTADIYKLLINDEREESRVMANKPFTTLETQRVLAGLDFSGKTEVTSEQAKAVHELFEKQTRVFNHLPRTLSRYAATGAPVMFQSAGEKQDETPSDAPKFRK